MPASLAPQVSDLAPPTPWQLFRVIYWFLLALCFIIGVILLSLPDQRQQGEFAAIQSSREDLRQLEERRPEIMAWSEAALKSFLAAPSVQERAAHVVDAERVLPLMTAYYGEKRKGQQLFPVAYQEYSFNRPFYHPWNRRLAAEVHLFAVTPPAMLALPVLREQEGGTGKVDWEYFSQWLEDYFEWFTSQPRPGRARFHLYATRLGGGAGEGAEALILSGSNDPARAVSIEQAADQAPMKQIIKALPEEVKKPVHVELEWRHEDKARPARLAISAFLADSWGFNVPKVTNEAADLPTADDAISE